MLYSKEEVIESLLQAKSNLNQALEDLDRFPAFDPGTIAYAAHALNNYLSVTTGTVDLLALALAEHTDKQVHTWIEGLRQATSLMSHTTSRLMNAACTQSPDLIRGKVNLKRLARRVCEYYQRSADQKGIKIAFKAKGGAFTVWSDRVATAAVMDNLLSNAVKYSPRDTEIEVTVAAKGDRVQCAVKDQGPGLSPEDHGRLFQRGVRLSAVPTMGEPSTGYGLAVAKDLIDQLAGEIGCVSEFGRGATFYFTLPNPS